MKKILLVTDDIHVQLLLTEEFEEGGYEVLIVSDKKEAISLLANHSKKPDVVILDLNVHEKSGSEPLGHVLKQKFKLPVIIFPAHSIFRRDVLKKETDAYKVKSSEMFALRKKVQDLI
ncbi:MAG TPA: response regulator [Desulfomonilia bacterium]|nr:response regulator [Desulfomonilia bacterium]